MPALNVVANDKGDQLVLVNNKWEPVTQTAVNETGNKAYLVNNVWLIDEPEAAPPPEMSVGQAVGLTGRGVSPYMTAASAGAVGGMAVGLPPPVGGAAGVGALGLTDLATGGYNMLAHYAGLPRVRSGSDMIADMFGFSKPQTPGQQMYVNALQAATGAGAQASAARTATAAMPANSTSQYVMSELAKQPIAQVAAGTTASVASDYAREQGVDNPVLLAVIGMGSGVLGGGLVGAAERKVRNLRSPNLTLDSVRQKAKAKYAEVDNAGVIFEPQSYENFINTVEQNLTNAGFNPNAHTPITTWINRLEKSRGSAGTLAELDAFRSQLRKSLGKSKDENTLRLMDEITTTIDNYVGNAGPGDIFTGNLPQAQQAIGDARKLWTQLSKGEAIEDLLTRASYREGSQSAAIRAQFRQLADNDVRMRQFSEIEQDFIRDVAKGRPLAKALEFFGEKSINFGGLLAAGGTANAATHFLPGIDPTTGLVAGGGMMGAGGLMKLGATGLTRGQARDVQQMGLGGRVSTGGPRNALLSQSAQNAINRSTMDPALAAALGLPGY
jgi:hypothetical protein